MQIIDTKDSEKLGEYLIRKNYITQTQLDNALALAKERQSRLGRMLVELKYITGKQLMDSLLERLKTSELGNRKKLGEVLISSGIITSEQLMHAIEVQQDRKQRIGEVLVGLVMYQENRSLMHWQPNFS